MKISKLTWIAPVLLISACSPTPSEPTAKPVENEVVVQECDIARFENLIGQPMEIFASGDYPQNTRIIEPGTMVTRDYRADRMNIDIDEAGIITKIWCG